MCDQSWLYSGSWDGFIKVLSRVKILSCSIISLIVRFSGSVVDPIRDRAFLPFTSLGGQGWDGGKVCYMSNVIDLCRRGHFAIF